MLAAIQSSCGKLELFPAGCLGHMGYEDERALRLKIKSKISDAYDNLESFVPTEGKLSKPPTIQKIDSSKSAVLVDALVDGKAGRFRREEVVPDGAAGQLVVASNERVTASAKQALASTLMVPTATGGRRSTCPARRLPSEPRRNGRVQTGTSIWNCTGWSVATRAGCGVWRLTRATSFLRRDPTIGPFESGISRPASSV